MEIFFLENGKFIRGNLRPFRGRHSWMRWEILKRQLPGKRFLGSGKRRKVWKTYFSILPRILHIIIFLHW